MKHWFQIVLYADQIVSFANKHGLQPGEILVIGVAIPAFSGVYASSAVFDVMYYAEKELSIS